MYPLVHKANGQFGVSLEGYFRGDWTVLDACSLPPAARHNISLVKAYYLANSVKDIHAACKAERMASICMHAVKSIFYVRTAAAESLMLASQ